MDHGVAIMAIGCGTLLAVELMYKPKEEVCRRDCAKFFQGKPEQLMTCLQICHTKTTKEEIDVKANGLQ